MSGNVNGMPGINLALAISGIGHTNIKKLKLQECPQFSTTRLEETALLYYQIRTSAHHNDRKDRGIIL